MKKKNKENDDPTLAALEEIKSLLQNLIILQGLNLRVNGHGRISKFEGAVLGKRCYKQVHDRLL